LFSLSCIVSVHRPKHATFGNCQHTCLCWYAYGYVPSEKSAADDDRGDYFYHNFK
jgi:hypothetical protein